VSNAPKAAIAEARAELRAALAARGFTDDGVLLRGPVPWEGPDGPTTAMVDVTVADGYPFAPPVVRIHQAGADIRVTFHQDGDEALCLWDRSEPAGDATWTNPDGLISRIAGWFEQTAAGWPDDDDTDLERYVRAPRALELVLYDGDSLIGVSGCVRTTTGEHTITVHDDPRQAPARSRSRKQGRTSRHGKTSLPRNQQHLAYVRDLGTLGSPIRDWDDLAEVLAEAADVRRYINQGAVELLVLLYRRGEAAGVLALAASPGHDGKPPGLRPHVAADTSLASRTLRAGSEAVALGRVSVAIVGCGAVGSYVADLLYREGVRRLRLIDNDIYRPGNVIRHAAPGRLIGTPKAQAVQETLLGLDLGPSAISFDQCQLTSPDDALLLLRESDVVIDATADERATALLRWASETTSKPVISACLLRGGGIARADRFPLRNGEKHLPAVPLLHGQPVPLRERGCGDAVSPTPPSAVVAAAELAVELARDELLLDCAGPASILRVLHPQPDAPYADLATLTAEPR
jgi:hypothetical protein